jgi:hypothetical protein
MSLKHLKSALDKVSHVEAFALGVINLVTNVGIALLEKVHHW